MMIMASPIIPLYLANVCAWIPAAKTTRQILDQWYKQGAYVSPVHVMGKDTNGPQAVETKVRQNQRKDSHKGRTRERMVNRHMPDM